MVANTKETAEQMLLKMIDTSQDPSMDSKTEKKVVKKQNTLMFQKIINRLLILLVIGAVGFVGYKVMDGLELLRQDVTFSVNTKSQSVGEGKLIPSPQRLSYYLSSVNRRNIFKPFELESNKATVDAADKNKRLAQQIKNLRLVGVSWLDHVDTASVMIEDTDKKETYFLKKGEKIGEISVKTIYADSAVLGYQNEEITIRYDKSQL